jgi:hypothetical protein
MRLASVALLLAAFFAAEAPSNAFLVGALRRDGVIVPFAAFDGKHWSAPWPLPDVDRAIPINLESIPKHWWGKAGPRETWQASVSGATRTLRVTQPDVATAHCVRQIGLRTDYQPAEPPPPPDVQPYPKDGLAVSPPQLLEPIAVIGPAANEILSLWSTVRDAFNKAERDTASRFHDPMTEKTREKYDPEVEVAYAYGADPRAYYVESSRTYRAIGGDDCTIAFGTGWFTRSGDTYKTLAMTVDLVSCDRYNASYMLPFGVMKIADHMYWIAQFSGWNHERFVVIDVKPKGVEAVLNVWGGSC